MLIFKDEDEVLVFVNSLEFGLGVGVWSWNMNCVYYFGCKIEVGCVWINCYYMYLVYVVFGGYKKLGIGWEIYKLVFDYY